MFKLFSQYIAYCMSIIVWTPSGTSVFTQILGSTTSCLVVGWNPPGGA